MKKFTLLFALLCASVMGFAKDYCSEIVSTSQEDITVTVKQTGELETTFIFESPKLANRTEWQNCNPSSLGGGTLSASNLAQSTIISYSTGKMTCVTTWTSYPTGNMTIYFSLYRDFSAGGSDIMTFTIADINPAATCPAPAADNELPVMVSASKESCTYNSVVINVQATDNVGVTKYVVKNHSDNSSVGEYSPESEQITIQNLAQDNAYNWDIYAKDAAGNVSENAINITFSTPARSSECEGDLGHFGTWATKRVHYKIEYLPSVNKIRYEVSGVPGQVLDFCQIQTTSGNSENLPIIDGVAVWKQEAPAAGTEMGILVLYSTDLIPGNEMNAENLTSFTGNNAHLIYYKSRDCVADPEPAYAPTTTPAENTMFNDCQIYSIIGSDYYLSCGWNSETNAWGGGTATSETINGREVLHIANSAYLERGFNPHDVSGFTHLHFDVWTQEAMNLRMKIMAYDNGWKEGDSQNFTSAAGAWKSVDLPLSAFNHTYLNQIQGIYPSNMGHQDVYFTNIYFYKTTDDVACYETLNLAEGKPSEGGYVPGNEGEVPAKANDGNEGSLWVTWANRPASEEWWYVDLKNNYNISKIEVVWGADYSSEYILQTRTDAPSAADKADDAAWVTIATVTDAAANSTSTSTFTTATGRYVRFHSLTKPSNCIRVAEIRVFGTGYAVTDVNDPVITAAEVADDSENSTSVKLHLVATDVEDGVVTTFLLNMGDDNWLPIETDANNCYLVSPLARGHYSYQVKARDHAGNMSAISTINFNIINPAENLALDQPVEAGYTPGNAAERPAKANDGSLTTGWATYNARPMEEQWWSVDLGDVYQLASVDLFWLLNVQSDHYLIQVAHSEPTDRSDDTQWYTALEVNEAQQMGETESDKNHYAITASARYVRFKAITKNSTYLNMRELRLFGSAYADADVNAPAITTASVSYHEDKAILTLEATDTEVGVVKLFRVINTTTGDKQMLTTNNDNQIIIEGLTPNTLYAYEIQAMDKAANLSAVRQLNVNIPVSSGDNIARNKPVYAGFETGGAGESKEKANDGNPSTYWATWATGDITREWLYVDLQGLYDLKQVVVTFEAGLISGDYILQYRREEPTSEQAADDDAWEDIAEVTTASATNLTIASDASGVARYVRFRTKTANVRLAELEVYANAAVVAFNETNNTSIISANEGALVNAEITRTFPNTDEWYTLCLPFDLSDAQLTEVFGAGYTLAEMVGAEDRGSLLHLNFDYIHSFEAGKAYLLRPGTGVTTAPTFNGVTIKNVNPATLKSANTYMEFQGTFESILLNNDNQRFVGPENYLYSPAVGGTTMKAFRCYFTIPNSSPLAGAPGKRAKIVFGPQTTTDVENVQDNVQCTKVLRDGQLYIIRDGRTYDAQGQLIK